MKLPEEFIERTKPLLDEEWNEFINALSGDTPTSIRVNTNKYIKYIDFEQVKWCKNGFYLSDRPQFTFDPLFHGGAYYVQEASSMFLEQAVKQLIDSDVKVLDLCAAPGGKSTLLSSLLSKESLLVCNEIIRSRAHVLSENLMKWGNSNSIVTNNKPEDYSSLKHFFDLVVVDAPCSGEGMFRKDEQAIEEWSVDNVKLCAQRQKEILASVGNALKPGGYFFYSTCTYNEEENEEIVEWLCTNHDFTIVELDISDDWAVNKSDVLGKETYHFFPHRTRGEGFYLAVLQKREEDIDNRYYKQNKRSNSKLSKPYLSEYQKYISESDSFSFFEINNYIYAFPENLYNDLVILRKELNILSQGICLGQIKGKDFIPHQSLALSNELNREAFYVEEVDWKTAISYLRREAIVLPNAEKGYTLLTYKNLPIGFVKNLGNRANNLFPNEWRIRSQNIPENEVVVLR